LKPTTRPVAAPRPPAACPLDMVAAGPWQDWQPTSISFQPLLIGVRGRVIALLEIRVWHSAHIRFAFWKRPVQCNGSSGAILSPGTERTNAFLATSQAMVRLWRASTRETRRNIAGGAPPEGVLDLEVGRRAVSAFRVNEELAVAREEPRRDTKLTERGAAKNRRAPCRPWRAARRRLRGDASCASGHPGISRLAGIASRSAPLQPATADTVLGDFSRRHVQSAWCRVAVLLARRQVLRSHGKAETARRPTSRSSTPSGWRPSSNISSSSRVDASRA